MCRTVNRKYNRITEGDREDYNELGSTRKLEIDRHKYDDLLYMVAKFV